MRLKGQLEELQRQAVVSPAPVVPDVVASAPPTLAQADPMASAAAAVASRPAAPPVVSAWSTFFPIPTEAESAAIDPLQDAIRQQAASSAAASSAASCAAAGGRGRIVLRCDGGGVGPSEHAAHRHRAVAAHRLPGRQELDLLHQREI